MLFSVIYSVDVPNDVCLARFLPRDSIRRRMGGGVSVSEYRYLGEGWERAREWKGCAVLTRTQFEAFVEDTSVFADDIETMGSLGAPGFGGLAPAISFRGNDPESIQNAYVTPILDRTPAAMEREGVWERIRSAVIRQFEHGTCSHFTRVPYEARCRYQDRISTYGPEYTRRVRRECRDMKNFLSGE